MVNLKFKKGCNETFFESEITSPSEGDSLERMERFLRPFMDGGGAPAKGIMEELEVRDTALGMFNSNLIKTTVTEAVMNDARDVLTLRGTVFGYVRAVVLPEMLAMVFGIPAAYVSTWISSYQDGVFRVLTDTEADFMCAIARIHDPSEGTEGKLPEKDEKFLSEIGEGKIEEDYCLSSTYSLIYNKKADPNAFYAVKAGLASGPLSGCVAIAEVKDAAQLDLGPWWAGVAPYVRYPE